MLKLSTSLLMYSSQIINQNYVQIALSSLAVLADDSH